MKNNTSSLKNSITYVGEVVQLTHYPDKDDVTYNADTEVPTYPIQSVTFVKALVEDPSVSEVKNGAGLIDLSAKKFVFLLGAGTVEKGDSISLSGNTYKVVLLRHHLTRVVAFANGVQS